MQEFDFDESVGCWVAQTSHALRRALNEELAKEGVTFRQWEVLAWCSLGAELSQVELAERMGIEAPALAGILARMERDGWLERVCCSQDRRKKRVRLTPKAESVWNAAQACCRAVRARAIEGLTADEVATFKGTCELIRQNLGQPADTPVIAHITE